jgi:RecJ-like exonuclease
MTCPRCHGRGYVGGTECPRCEGRGEVEMETEHPGWRREVPAPRTFDFILDGATVGRRIGVVPAARFYASLGRGRVEILDAATREPVSGSLRGQIEDVAADLEA